MRPIFTVLVEAWQHHSDDKRPGYITTRIRAFNLADAIGIAKALELGRPYDLKHGVVYRDAQVTIGFHFPGMRGVTYIPVCELDHIAETIMQVASDMRRKQTENNAKAAVERALVSVVDSDDDPHAA